MLLCGAGELLHVDPLIEIQKLLVGGLPAADDVPQGRCLGLGELPRRARSHPGQLLDNLVEICRVALDGGDLLEQPAQFMFICQILLEP